MKPIRTKICGITRVTDAVGAAEAGADAIGLNFYSRSKRFVAADVDRAIADAVGEQVALVGVFVNSTIEEVCEIASRVGLTHVQFHGDEQPAIVEELNSILADAFSIRAVRIEENDFEKAQSDIDRWQDAGVDAILLDAASVGAFGGTGKQLDWGATQELSINVPWILAGGLNPDNVSEAIVACNPDGVDVASGVESEPGIKDDLLVRDFVSRAKAGWERT